MKILYLIILAIACNVCQAQMRKIPIRITDGVSADTLFFGLDVNATNGIDVQLGENELPPTPPTGIFDVRFVGDGLNPQVPIGQGLKSDYRPADTLSIVNNRYHKVRYQLGSGTSFTINWWDIDLRITVNIIDLFNGPILNHSFSGTGSYTFNANQTALQQFLFNINYSFILPVELSTFTSTVSRNNVTLNWTTLSETNNRSFDIERKSVNSEEWDRVGNVAGYGTTTQPQTYSFTERLYTGNYNYRLKQIDFNGNYEYFYLENNINIGVFSQFSISQNYPNPFNPSTKIDFEIPYDAKVSILLYDLSGKLVGNIFNEDKTAGYYTVNFNASGLSSGMYFYRISAEGNGNNFNATKKMILLK